MNTLFLKKAYFYKIFFLIGSGLIFSCSPLKTSPKEEKHQMELTLHEIQTNLDDLKHNMNCFQTEIQILDGKIRHQDNSISSLKEQHIEKLKLTLDAAAHKLSSLQDRQSLLEKTEDNAKNDINSLSSHANNTTLSLTQFKDKINELEKKLLNQSKNFDEINKLKTTLESIAHYMHKNEDSGLFTYKVKPGDSLEKIAKNHKISVEKLKKANNLSKDLIVIDQELSIPDPHF